MPRGEEENAIDGICWGLRELEKLLDAIIEDSDSKADHERKENKKRLYESYCCRKSGRSCAACWRSTVESTVCMGIRVTKEGSS